MPSPATPPLARLTPHRHSISHAPPSLGQTPRGTVIAVTTPPAPALTPTATTPVTTHPTNRTTSRDSAERDSGNPSPDVTHSGSGRASRSPGGLQGSEGSMEFDSLSVDADDSIVEETGVVGTASALASAATTVIHLTGNSVSRARGGTPESSNPPPSPLRPLPEVTGEEAENKRSSQDSLASTGSNQELRTELASALTEVRAVVEEVVLQQTSPEVEELANRPAGSREGVGRQLLVEAAAFSSTSSSTASSRKVSAELGARNKTPAVTPRSSRGEQGKTGEDGVVLKQTSWGSRQGGLDQREEGNGSFLRNRDLWERRTTSTPTSDEDAPRAGGPQGLRGFWESRTSTPATNRNPKHTPDLVMDLPQGALASSPPVPAPRPVHLRRRSRSPSSDSSIASDSSPPSTSPSITTADNFAADTDTLRKTSVGPVAKARPAPLAMPEPGLPRQAVASESPRSHLLPIRSPGPRTPSSPFSSPSSFAPAASSFKPAVKVKPMLQVKPSETKDSKKS